MYRSNVLVCGGTGCTSSNSELIIPVSYTHLDVYKRQGYQFVEGQKAQQVTVNSEGVNPESITFLVEKINTDFAGGDGSEENPFLIMNAEQFNKIRNYRDKHFVLGADIALGEYTPIESFSGSLNLSLIHICLR